MLARTRTCGNFVDYKRVFTSSRIHALICTPSPPFPPPTYYPLPTRPPTPLNLPHFAFRVGDWLAAGRESVRGDLVGAPVRVPDVDGCDERVAERVGSPDADALRERVGVRLPVGVGDG